MTPTDQPADEREALIYLLFLRPRSMSKTDCQAAADAILAGGFNRDGQRLYPVLMAARGFAMKVRDEPGRLGDMADNVVDMLTEALFPPPPKETP